MRIFSVCVECISPVLQVAMSESGDELVRLVGEVGRWQVRQSVLLSLVGVLCGWQVLCVVFLAPPTDHWCAPPAGLNWTTQQWRQTLPLETRVSQTLARENKISANLFRDNYFICPSLMVVARFA